MAIALNVIMLERLYPKSKKEFLLQLLESLYNSNINTGTRIVHFLAQVGYETKNLTVLESTDTDTFKYRGLLKLQGEKNYKQYSLDTYGDLRIIDNPELVSADIDAIKSAIWVWENYRLNDFADNDQLLFISKAIHFGNPYSRLIPEGYRDRDKNVKYLKRLLKL